MAPDDRARSSLTSAVYAASRRQHYPLPNPPSLANRLHAGAGSFVARSDRAEDLKGKRAEIDVEGAGSAIVNVSDALDARVGGVGSVGYVGNPMVEKDVSGAGRVSKH